MRKIRTLIADDDAIILKGMKKFIDWDQYGFMIVATACNGKQLLDICEKEEIDVLITDIEMPRMNGLEVMKKIREWNKDIKIIVISGFDKFEYAKQAIQYDVFYYLLKPINPVELISVLNKIKGEFFDSQPMQRVPEERQENIVQIVKYIRKRIDENEDDNISLEYISEHYYVSAAYFSRVFKEVVGMNYTKYRVNQKMKYAVYLLEHTNFRMYEIAEKLHYEDERYFSRVFKKYYGMTPKEWRMDKK